MRRERETEREREIERACVMCAFVYVFRKQTATHTFVHKCLCTYNVLSLSFSLFLSLSLSLSLARALTHTHTHTHRAGERAARGDVSGQGRRLREAPHVEAVQEEGCWCCTLIFIPPYTLHPTPYTLCAESQAGQVAAVDKLQRAHTHTDTNTHTHTHIQVPGGLRPEANRARRKSSLITAFLFRILSPARCCMYYIHKTYLGHIKDI